MKKSYGLYLFLLSAPVLFAQTTVTAVIPASGVTTGGDFVHIRRSDAHGPLFCPGVLCATSVKFGDAFGRIVSNTFPEIVAIAPPHAPGSVDVTVTITGIPAPLVLSNAYRYQSRLNEELERILLPVAASGPGPSSTRFEAEVSITNASDETVPVMGAAVPQNLGISPVPIPVVLPHTSGIFTDRLWNLPGHAGAFIYVPARLARDVITKVRVHDTSRDASAYGVEIPAVSDLDFAAAVRLTGIPTDARFRSTLRVFAYDAKNFGPVTLRVRDDADGTLLATVPVSLNAVPSEEEIIPASAQLSLDSIMAPLRGHARLRIDIADSDAIRPIWGFVSITNNQTQEITLVTPQRSGPSGTPEKIPLGTWDGGALISVTDAEVKAYLTCYLGTFKTPPLDSDGRFATTGFLSGGVGPPPLDRPHDTPMDFEGRVADGWITLTIRSGSRVFLTTRAQFISSQQPAAIPPGVCP